MVTHSTTSPTATVVDAVVSIAGDLDVDAVLLRTVETARELVGARYAALGVLDEEGEGLAHFIHVGLDDATAAAIGDLPTGRGLLGEVIRHPAPLRVDDAADHPASAGLPPGHPPVGAFLGVPVMVAGEVFGNLYLTGKPDGFSAADQRLLLALATVAGTAIRNADAAARLAARELLQRVLAELATAVLAGARRGELLASIEVAAGELLPRARARVVPADDAPPPGPTVITHELEAAEDTVLVVDVADVSPWRLTAAAIAALDTMCRQAGVALAYADARSEVRRLAVASERDRIARDLHDTVIQRLFGAGLQLDVVTRHADDDVAASVELVIGEVDAAIAELRSTIARLDSPRPSDLADRVAAVVAALTPACPGLVDLVVEGDLATLSDDVAEDVPAVLREGITNAAKHAAATTVVPRLVVDDDSVEVTVTDDGVGPGVGAHPESLAAASLGLRNLTVRAARHGGSCVLEEISPAGSRLVWRVPHR